MCIIVAKRVGVDMPDIEILERCFAENPHGAGFMYADGKAVRICKGFMDFGSFAEAINNELGGVDKRDVAIVMHFRIATHGKVQPSTCHPFPVSSNPDDLRETEFSSRFGVAHNGVIHGMTTNNDWSDTMDYVAEVIAPLSRINPNFMMSDDALEILEKTCDSKLAIMDHSGEIVTIGKFYETDGVLYSNTSYLNRFDTFSTFKTTWDDESYYSAYPYYGKGYDDWEDMEHLVKQLPYPACQNCQSNEECALNYPYCESELMAEEAREWFDELMEEELA